MEKDWIVSLDWFLAPIYIIVILVVAVNIQKKQIKSNPIYVFFVRGLAVKIFGGVAVTLVYVFYYRGGDTFAYHLYGGTMVNLLYHSPMDFIQVLFGDNSAENYSCFTEETGFPGYWNDIPAFNTIKLMSFPELLGLKLYLPVSVLMGFISFTGIWKLYIMFCECYPNLYKQFAISILFIPSVCFWGSGVLKDAWTIAAAGWYCYSFYRIFINRKKLYSNIFTLLLSILIMVLIKPYVFVALLPGSLIWMVWSRILAIRSTFIRILVAPIIFFIGLFFGFILWTSTSSNLREYRDLDSILLKASVSSEDLKRERYHGSSFDIGSYDATLSGVILKFPIATLTGLFRPFLWESRNPVMYLSGFENLIFLFITVYFLLRRPASFLSSLFTNPLVLFSIIFGIFFAFSVAISTSNFGALVRLRIPAIPFFLSGILLVEYLSREKENAKKANYLSKKRAEYMK